MFDRAVVDQMPPGPELGGLLATVDHTILDAADTLAGWTPARVKKPIWPPARPICSPTSPI